MTELKHVEMPISYSAPVSIIVNDDVEGDMTFGFSLVKDKADDGSYTRYKAMDSHSVNIEITNAFRDKTVRLQEPLLVGTFHGTHDLYLMYELSKANESDERIISVTFLIKSK